MREIKLIVIHCSATENGAEVRLEDIDRWHRERGWQKIGYHFVIERDGRLRPGRPVSEIGAHAYGHNANSVGICMVGTDRFSRMQWLSLRQLVSGLRHQFPGAGICGHRDLSPDTDGDGIIERWEWLKTCPGFDVAAWLANGMIPSPEAVLDDPA